MNLWLRLLHLIVASFARPRLDPMTDASCLGFRVWPHDLDISMHVNNSRYWALMDLGRIDLIIRSGLWRAVVRNRWAPIVNAAMIRFRRELRLFRRFRVETRIVAWTQTFVVMEHRVVTRRQGRARHRRGRRPRQHRPLRSQGEKLRAGRAPVRRDRPRGPAEPGAESGRRRFPGHGGRRQAGGVIRPYPSLSGEGDSDAAASEPGGVMARSAIS